MAERRDSNRGEEILGELRRDYEELNPELTSLPPGLQRPWARVIGGLKKLKHISDEFSRILQELRLERYGAKILIVGNTGVGKTSLVNALLAPESHRGVARQSTTSTKLSGTHIGMSGSVILVDTPGNRLFRSELEKQLQQVVQGGVLGVINVVAYGYTDSRAWRPESDEPSAYESPGIVNQEYLASARAREFDFLRQWFKGPLREQVHWMLTVVNKYDLWWRDRGEVLEYYGNNGHYGRTAVRTLGGANYSVTPTCAAPLSQRIFRGARLGDEPLSNSEIEGANELFLGQLAARIASRTEAE